MFEKNSVFKGLKFKITTQEEHPLHHSTREIVFCEL